MYIHLFDFQIDSFQRRTFIFGRAVYELVVNHTHNMIMHKIHNQLSLHFLYPIMTNLFLFTPSFLCNDFAYVRTYIYKTAVFNIAKSC